MDVKGDIYSNNITIGDFDTLLLSWIEQLGKKKFFNKKQRS